MLERRTFLTGGLAALVTACNRSPAQAEPVAATPGVLGLIEAARAQIGVTLSYDSAYSSLAYPGGDIDRSRGVCTDVVIRAYRDSLDIDLQREVHEDMAAAFSRYPRRWGLSRPDRNIDHRRVPNLEAFWTRKGARLPLLAADGGWRPGDMFASLVGGKLPHTGIISDRLSPGGGPMAVHNIGAGTQEESLWQVGKLTARYRWLV